MQKTSQNTQLSLFTEQDNTLNLAAHFPQLATLEKHGAKPINTIEKLARLWIASYKYLLSDNIHSHKTEKIKYDRYRRVSNAGFLGWLHNFTCKDCNFKNDTKLFEFHHRDPKQKLFTVLGGGLGKHTVEVRVEYLKEVLKCDYLCPLCHYKRHSNLGDVDEDFKAINRRRHSYIQNVLGCSD